jgi:uncharacterized membrane protein (DUF373 family)
VNEKHLNRGIYYIELVVAVILVLLTVLAVVALVFEVWGVITTTFALTPAQFTGVISLVLEVFILIELFRIALAYMAHRNVIPTVLEAALVAIARKFVVFEPGADFLAYATGHAVLLLAVAVSWWLLHRSRAHQTVEEMEKAPSTHL